MPDADIIAELLHHLFDFYLFIYYFGVGIFLPLEPLHHKNIFFMSILHKLNIIILVYNII